MKKLKQGLKRLRDLIIKPKRFFTRIVADGNMEESMFKAFIYGLIGGCLVLLLKLCSGATITISSVFWALIIIPVLAVALLYVLGGLMMLVAEMTDGERDWEIAIKGLASVFFVYPVILALNALAFNCTSMWIVSLLGDAYVLFLFYNIALYCMRGKRSNVIIVISIFALFLIMVYASDFHTGWFMLKNPDAAMACEGLINA